MSQDEGSLAGLEGLPKWAFFLHPNAEWEIL